MIGEFLKVKMKARILRLKVDRYVLYDNKLYKIGYSMPLMKCIPPTEVEYIMRKIHEGICGNHTLRQSLVFKTPKQGYYWPTMKADCMELARKYNKCQRFSHASKAHPKELTSMTSPWPFAVWGIYLTNQLPKQRGSVQYAVLVVNYFTK